MLRRSEAVGARFTGRRLGNRSGAGVGVLSVVALAVLAAGWSRDCTANPVVPVITRLPNVGVDLDPIVSDRYVAWTLGPRTTSSYDTQEVVIYDRASASFVDLGTSPLRRTYSSVTAIAGDRVSWYCQRYGQADHDVVLFDGSGLSLLTDDTAFDTSPTASPGYINWFSGSPQTLWKRYDLATEQITQVPLPRPSAIGSRASDHWAAYWVSSTGNNRLYLYDGVQERPITEYFRYMADLSERYLAYKAGDGQSLGYVYELATGQKAQIPLAYVDQIQVTETHAIVTGRRAQDGNNKPFLFDIASGTLQPLTGEYAMNPHIDGVHAVWEGEIDNSIYIYYHNIAAGQTQILGHGAHADIHGDTVVWHGSGQSSYDADIYMAIVPEPSGLGLLGVGLVGLRRRIKRGEGDSR